MALSVNHEIREVIPIATTLILELAILADQIQLRRFLVMSKSRRSM